MSSGLEEVTNTAGSFNENASSATSSEASATSSEASATSSEASATSSEASATSSEASESNTPPNTFTPPPEPPSEPSPENSESNTPPNTFIPSPEPPSEPSPENNSSRFNIPGRDEELAHKDQPYDDTNAQRISAQLIHQYFSTQNNPLTRHHLESYDQFLQRDFSAILKANPIRVLKNPKSENKNGERGIYKYTVNVFIGGEQYDKIRVGTPTIVLKQGKEDDDIRILFPNEARLRNLTYTCPIFADIVIRIKYDNNEEEEVLNIPNYHLINMPLMLHSKYCILHNKPQVLLQEMGECPQDPGGYFVIGGSEKVLITSQQQSFNTLWIKEQPTDENIHYYGNISCLNDETREVRPVKFYWSREKMAKDRFGKNGVNYTQSVLEVGIPLVFKPLPIFVLFRALGVQTDKDILQLIFPDLNSPEARYLSDLLLPSLTVATPFFDTYTSIQYIKNLTKNFSIYSVLDILHNQLFPHVEDKPGNRVAFLADCVRKMLRVVKGLEPPASRDDTRNQRLLTSGFLIQQLFQQSYKTYIRKVMLNIDTTYSYNESIYTDDKFKNIFEAGNINRVFASNMLTESILRGFKGKWQIGVSKEAEGVLQELSRLSYLDFISHLRRAVLDFDTEIKLQGPRRLNPSQYGYFCTSETPSGGNIGIVKNLSIMTAISTSMIPKDLINWLTSKAGVIPVEYMTPETKKKRVPVYVNAGIIGYCEYPNELRFVLRSMKRSGCLPPLSSSTFSIPQCRIDIYTDEGRPCRPLIACNEGKAPAFEKFGSISNIGEMTKGSIHFKSWRELVVGSLLGTREAGDQPSIHSRSFVDPLKDEKVKATLKSYMDFFNKDEVKGKMGIIEYLDPYEQNEALIASYPKHILAYTTHLEVHPSTILGLLGNSIPFLNHNQSPRNQLGSSQSKQSLSIYATNWKNRFDNQVNILCYGEAPLTRTLYQDYYGYGQMPYGQNVILAIGMYGGYNQEDGIIMNADALARGQFRSMNYRTYETFEEDDSMTKIMSRVGNPANVAPWLDLKPQLDYSKLGPDGIIREGEYVDQYTVIVGKYQMSPGEPPKDASLTPQVWTSGRVERVVVIINNLGLKLIKIRVVQDRVPQLGDKFSNRHGQKGTANVFYRGHDMPRTADGIVPDMIMNPTAIPSRMTIGQLLEQISGLAAVNMGGIANGTAFMNIGSPHEAYGRILEEYGLEKMGNHVLYNGMTGEQIQADIFMGVVYGMRLKHMTDDKWNARGQGRKEQRTRQPTGGRGNEGGLKIGEMDRDAILGHGVASFLKESMMERSDASKFIVCNGCGTIPLYNERNGFYLCPLCDGPIKYAGDNVNTLEPILPPNRSQATFSKIEYPYASKLFIQELETFLNMGMRILTTSGLVNLHGIDTIQALDPTLSKGSSPQILQPRQAVVEDNVDQAQAQAQAPTANDLALQVQAQAQVQEQVKEPEVQLNPFPSLQAVSNQLAQEPEVQLNSFQPLQAVSNQPAKSPQAPNQYPPPTETVVQNQPLPPAPAPNLATTFVSGVPTPIAQPEGPNLNASLTNTQLPPPTAPPTKINPLQSTDFRGGNIDTRGSIPVISVDTSDAALLADGLKEANTTEIPSPFDAAKQATRSRRLPRRQSTPNLQTNQINQTNQQSLTEEPEQKPSTGPVTVVKLG